MEETKLVENYIQIIQDSLSAPMKSDSIYQRKRERKTMKEKRPKTWKPWCVYLLINWFWIMWWENILVTVCKHQGGTAEVMTDEAATIIMAENKTGQKIHLFVEVFFHYFFKQNCLTVVNSALEHLPPLNTSLNNGWDYYTAYLMKKKIIALVTNKLHKLYHWTLYP